ncbi:MAG: hypothetical protein P4L40_15605 [Terracidiphilus sp.]|nr:hypothetical protein [Terracidiphilus sp.]
MKKFALALLLLAAPAWGARPITVGQLEDLLHSLAQDHKSDPEVANALKQVELSEQLTRSTMNSLVSYVPGPLSTEQVYVLEARSSLLAPPERDLPKTPAPDTAAQKTLLDKAAAYVTGTYDRLPALTATRTTVRFQDNVEAAASFSGTQSGAKDVSVGSSFMNPFQFIHYINSTESKIISEHGAEKPPAEKDKTPWGANRMIQLMEPNPSLGQVFAEAQVSDGFQWLRWETINGKPIAVFTFAVSKKKAHLPLNVCCFPDVTQAGIANLGSSTMPQRAPGTGAGTFQTATTWHSYRTSVPYHGELFVEPSSGIVVRLIVDNELNPSEVVHQVAMRIDYGPASIAGRIAVVPMRTVVITEVVPNGDSGVAGAYSERRTLFTSEYRDYKSAQ